MTRVDVGKNEPFEAAVRRFGRKVTEAGIISEIKRREFFESKSDKRRRKSAAARRRREAELESEE